MSIYILKCRSGKYYVGKTNRQVNDRIIEHFTNEGSEWTRVYKPIEVIEVIQNADPFDEDKYTKRYMQQFGIDNVRGGSYSSVILQDFQIRALHAELDTAENRCFRCGGVGHFANRCYVKTSNYYGINDSDDSSDEEEYCYRCGREGHFANECYARSDYRGRRL